MRETGLGGKVQKIKRCKNIERKMPKRGNSNSFIAYFI